MPSHPESEEFARRLKQALRSAGAETTSAVRLAKDFNDHYTGKAVTRQAVQNWLSGLTVPTQDKLRALADWLQTTPDWLRYGSKKDAASLSTQDAASVTYRLALSDQELVRRYRKLSDRQQQAVAEIITALATKDTRR